MTCSVLPAVGQPERHTTLGPVATLNCISRTGRRSYYDRRCRTLQRRISWHEATASGDQDCGSVAGACSCSVWFRLVARPGTPRPSMGERSRLRRWLRLTCLQATGELFLMDGEHQLPEPGQPNTHCVGLQLSSFSCSRHCRRRLCRRWERKQPHRPLRAWEHHQRDGSLGLGVIAALRH